MTEREFMWEGITGVGSGKLIARKGFNQLIFSKTRKPT